MDRKREHKTERIKREKEHKAKGETRERERKKENTKLMCVLVVTTKC